jgi:hypothetical protein
MFSFYTLTCVKLSPLLQKEFNYDRIELSKMELFRNKNLKHLIPSVGTKSIHNQNDD